jgi:hypothetical protein
MESRRCAYTYKVLKSSWGIWISIIVTIQNAQARKGRSDLVKRSTGLRFEKTATGLSETYRTALVTGWDIVAASAERSVGNEVRVIVEDVKFVDTDFQVEGLSVAMVRWAEKVFKLDTWLIEVSFDRSANRYDFDWGSQPGSTE